MNDPLRGFHGLELDKNYPALQTNGFVEIIHGTDLSRCERIKKVRSEYRGKPGIYFWVMRYDFRLFRIYVGKTRCLSIRVGNYTAEFQPQSPNDYKMRVFRAFLVERLPDAALDLYFSVQDEDGSVPVELTRAENLAIDAYDPLLNRLNKKCPPSAAARNLLRDAFAVYYRSSFEQLLKEPEVSGKDVH